MLGEIEESEIVLTLSGTCPFFEGTWSLKLLRFVTLPCCYAGCSYAYWKVRPIFNSFLIYLFEFIGWHWFTKSYRFQVYNSITNCVHTASCAHIPKQSLFLSPFLCLCPLLPSPNLPSPLAITVTHSGNWLDNIPFTGWPFFLRLIYPFS